MKIIDRFSEYLKSIGKSGPVYKLEYSFFVNSCVFLPSQEVPLSQHLEQSLRIFLNIIGK